VPHPAFRCSPRNKSFFSTVPAIASVGRFAGPRKNSFYNFGAAAAIRGKKAKKMYKQKTARSRFLFILKKFSQCPRANTGKCWRERLKCWRERPAREHKL
jgi:hypothetical protein